MSAVSGTARPQAGTDLRPPAPPAAGTDASPPGTDARRPGPPPEHQAAPPVPADAVPPGAVPAARPPASRPPARRPAASTAGSRPAPDAALTASTAANTAAACRVFAAQPVQVTHARRFIAGVLSGFGAAEDVVLCVCELANNAVQHSCSREPGGQFTVRVSVSPRGRIRAEVADRGGPWNPEPAPDGEHGRGLLIVDALATRWGITGSDAGRCAWLEFDPPPGPVIP